MENFKFIVISIIIIAGLGILGYWAFATIETGSTHIERETVKKLEGENEILREEIEKLKDELAAVKPEEEPQAPTPTPTTNPTYKEQGLINAIEDLLKDNVVMKEGSRGTRVGTIQIFLNLYNNTSKRVDNDFGPGLKTDLINFQKKEGLTADGQTGPSTYQKMIAWLKKQG